MKAPGRDRFVAHWLIIAGLLLAGAAAWRASADAEAGRAPVLAARGPARWYFALRMPEIQNSREAGVEAMRQRYAEWLRGLRRAGFAPATLSQARRALASGRGLPERAVVALFEPGRRRTQELVGPIFRAAGWPAVWLTDAAAMRAGSREYVSFHDARAMTRSGWWDVGYSRADGAYDIFSRDGRFTLGGNGAPPWSAIDGTFALNRNAPQAGLRTLTVNANWTASELIDRLRAEIPVERASCLGETVIQRREWGVTGRPASALASCPPLRVQAPEGKRGARLYWLGTAEARSFQLSLSADALVGELQLHLLADEESDSELTVVFSSRSAVVVSRRGGAASRLGALRREGPLSARVTLAQGRLVLEDAGAREPFTSPALDDGRRGLLELSVFEKVRGVARVEGLRLLFEPSPETRLAAGASR